jgi:predicted peptidase
MGALLMCGAVFVVLHGCDTEGTEPAQPKVAKARSAQEYVRHYVKTGQHAYHFGWLRYLMYIPADYPEQASKKYPAILYMHPLGQKGSDPWELAKCCLNKQLQPTVKDDDGNDVPNPDAKNGFPFIVVSPQLPGDLDWSDWPGPNMNRADWWNDYVLEVVDRLLDHLIGHYAIDESRIYCAGPSMGGYGTWRMAVKYPGRFAAISPQCGEGIPSEAAVLKDVPVWLAHGNCDEYLPVEKSDELYEALGAVGNQNVKYIRWTCEGDSAACIECEKKHYGDFFKACEAHCMECNHHKCYNNQFEELYEWFLSHSR